MRAELEEVYRQHRQALFSLALTITGCSSLAEDSVHDAFARLCQREQLQIAELVPYVFASVRNAAVSRKRLELRQQHIVESLFEESSRTGSNHSADSLAESDDSIELQKAIASLEESSSEIVIMKVYGELTLEQIASVVSQPVGTVATRYRRALLKIESRLGTHHG